MINLMCPTKMGARIKENNVKSNFRFEKDYC